MHAYAESPLVWRIDRELPDNPSLRRPAYERSHNNNIAPM